MKIQYETTLAVKDKIILNLKTKVAAWKIKFKSDQKLLTRFYASYDCR